MSEDDPAAQAKQATANLTQTPAAAGTTPSDAMRPRIYVVEDSPGKLEAIMPTLSEFHGDTLAGANRLIGVQALALGKFYIKLEATAQIA